jgi:hypothetical protein
VVETAAEAWRETVEENPGFEDIFDLNHFIRRAQSIASFHVRVDDVNGVHGTNYYALHVTDAEWNAIAQLPPSAERTGSLLTVICESGTVPVHRIAPSVGLTFQHESGELCIPRFYHGHELRALGMIAWHIAHGRLWSAINTRF